MDDDDPNSPMQVLQATSYHGDSDTEEVAGKIQRQMLNARLEAEEDELDELIRLATEELQDSSENEENKKFAFVTYRDIRSILEFAEQTVIAIKAPSETKLEVTDPREVGDAYSLVFRSFAISHGNASFLDESDLTFVPYTFPEPANLVEERAR